MALTPNHQPSDWLMSVVETGRMTWTEECTNALPLSCSWYYPYAMMMTVNDGVTYCGKCFVLPMLFSFALNEIVKVFEKP